MVTTVKRETDSPSTRLAEQGSPAVSANSRASIVVIGNGPVGFRFLNDLVRHEQTCHADVTVFGEESVPAYDRIHLSRLLEHSSTTALEYQPRQWYERHQITLHTDDPVESIDRQNRCVSSRSGKTVNYDHLVLATGSRAYLPPIEGIREQGVFAFRTVDDVSRIRSRATSSKTAIVLGGGLLGLESAFALTELGLHVTVVEKSACLMPRQLDNAAGRLLKQLIESDQLQVVLQRQAQSISRRDSELHVQFTAGDSQTADMVIVSAGIRPRDELARACHLSVGRLGGVVVDSTLQTSDPSIYAIGECAEHSGVVYGLAAPGFQMASALADRLHGKHTMFPGHDAATRLKLVGINVEFSGDYLDVTDADTSIWSSEQAYLKLILRERRLAGLIAVGDVPQVEQLQDAVKQHRRVSSWQLRRFRRRGVLWNSRQSPDPNLWPATATICSCMNIDRATLSAAVATGCTSQQMLTDTTSAGSCCGSCHPLLHRLAGGSAAAATPSLAARALTPASVLAVIVVFVLCFSTAVTAPASVQAAVTFRQMLVGSFFWKQVTGYSVTGLAALSVLISLRKRTRLLNRINFSWMQLTHIVLATCSVGGLLLHTGSNPGHNLNFILFAVFVVACTTGAATGILTGIEQRLPVSWRSTRRVATWLHILCLWPLPVLITFHLVAVYVL